MSVWIELPDEYGWGPTRALIVDLKRDGYHAEEVRGSEHLLWITGSRPDAASRNEFLSTH